MSPENLPPENWVGDLNASYSLGPGFINPRWKVKMNVTTKNQKRLTYNTIGILLGSIEDGTTNLFSIVQVLYYIFTFTCNQIGTFLLEITVTLGHLELWIRRVEQLPC